MKVNQKEKIRRKPISRKQFEALCAMQSTTLEICAVLDVCRQTLYSWVKEEYGTDSYDEVFNQKRSVGKVSLRRIQLKQAEKNSNMAIWLGKQWLGQEDVSRQKVEAEVTQKLTAEIEAKVRGELEQEMRVYGHTVQTNINVPEIDLSKLSDEELEQLEKYSDIMAKAVVTEEGDTNDSNVHTTEARD